MWPKLAGLAAMCLTVLGCATGPDEHALVKDEATAIAIGKKTCTENQAEVVGHDLSGAKWTARFDAGGGNWWVQKTVMLAPTDKYSGVVELQVLVNAMSGGTTSCDPEYMVESF